MSDDIAPSNWLPGNARPPREAKGKRSSVAAFTEPAKNHEQEAGWEYKTTRVPGRNQRRAHEKALNKMSEKGWELVSVNWGGLLRASNIATFRRQR